MAGPQKLFTFEFVSLCFVLLFAFCNMSVFYSFFNYLGRIGIPTEWRGVLVGLEPMSAFALRLAVIPLIHVGNAAAVMILALFMTIIALWSYTWAVSIPSLVALRIFHGAAFVLLVSAGMALLVHLIPREKSAQAFGVVSVTTLVPYAIMPLATETLLPYVGSEARVYAGVTILAVPGIFLLLALKKRLARNLDPIYDSFARRLSLKELRQDIGHVHVILLLAIHLLFYLCYATVFFFIKDYFKLIEAGDPGRFFTLATILMILVRVTGGKALDKVNKVPTLIVFSSLLIGWFLFLGSAPAMPMVYLPALYYGLCIGVISPLLSSALFLVSPEPFRGLNTNLSLFMMDAGFFLSPFIGGMLLNVGYSLPVLFCICAGLFTVIVILLLPLSKSALGVSERSMG